MAEHPLFWDAGIHVYDDAAPLRAGLSAKPPHAPIERYLEAYSAAGFGHVALSQPTSYGLDNSLLLKTLDRLEGRGRGFIVSQPLARSELPSLHQRGIRGIRYMMFLGGALGWETLAEWAPLAADMDWVIKLQLSGTQFHAAAPQLAVLPAKLLIDVYPGTLDMRASTLATLTDLMANDRCWVSLSAPVNGPDVLFDTFAEKLTQTRPDRCIWASNWPHGRPLPAPSPDRALDWLNSVAGKKVASQILQGAERPIG